MLSSLLRQNICAFQVEVNDKSSKTTTVEYGGDFGNNQIRNDFQNDLGASRKANSIIQNSFIKKIIFLNSTK
jgi:hypothetical protein